MILFSQIHTTIFYVKDIGISKDFYSKVLNFEMVDDDGDYVSFEVSKNEKSLLALNASEEYRDYVGHQSIVLTTDNIKYVYQQLKDNVKMKSSLLTKLWGQTFTFFDPDENMIEVLENSN